jgi:hypothetical protein
MAWEDIGLADPRAMQIANDAALTFERLGSPEGELALGQAVVYLAVAAQRRLQRLQQGPRLRQNRQKPRSAHAPAQRPHQAQATAMRAATPTKNPTPMLLALKVRLEVVLDFAEITDRKHIKD